MIEELIAQSAIDAVGGFVANRTANITDCVDPLSLYQHSLAVLIAADGSVYFAPVDASKPLAEQAQPRFLPMQGVRLEKRIGFLWRTAGFAIRDGEMQGDYLVSPDMLQTERFRKPKDYVNYLIQAV